jgi:hypothetical protein
MKKLILALGLASLAVPVGSALADPPPWAPAHGRRDRDDHRRDDDRRGYDRRDYDRRDYHRGNYDRRIYSRDGRYLEPRRLGRNDRVWRGRDNRYYCRRDNGTTGLIVGGAAGALLGRSLDGSGDRLLGTLLGGAGGALLGREIDRGGVRCR